MDDIVEIVILDFRKIRWISLDLLFVGCVDFGIYLCLFFFGNEYDVFVLCCVEKDVFNND